MAKKKAAVAAKKPAKKKKAAAAKTPVRTAIAKVVKKKPVRTAIANVVEFVKHEGEVVAGAVSKMMGTKKKKKK